jgi:hypothetical protein
MKKLSIFTLLLSSAVSVFSARNVWAQTATSSTRSSKARVVRNIGDVRTVYVRRLSGDREFARRLMNEMRSMSIRFVNNPRQADALFSARGDYDKGVFWGSMKFTNQAGRVLWSASATRPRGNNYMAYSRLADKLRTALRR